MARSITLHSYQTRNYRHKGRIRIGLAVAFFVFYITAGIAYSATKESGGDIAATPYFFDPVGTGHVEFVLE